MGSSGTDCARARESVSADLDHELPELELQRLRAHLRVCADCSAWAEIVKAATIQLREAPLEAPAAGFALPRRSRTWRVSPVVAVASAAALVASVVVSLGTQHGFLGGAKSTSTSRFTTTTTPRTFEEHQLGLDSLFAGSYVPLVRPGTFRAI